MSFRKIKKEPEFYSLNLLQKINHDFWVKLWDTFTASHLFVRPHWQYESAERSKPVTAKRKGRKVILLMNKRVKQISGKIKANGSQLMNTWNGS